MEVLHLAIALMEQFLKGSDPLRPPVKVNSIEKYL